MYEARITIREQHIANRDLPGADEARHNRIPCTNRIFHSRNKSREIAGLSRNAQRKQLVVFGEQLFRISPRFWKIQINSLTPLRMEKFLQL